VPWLNQLSKYPVTPEMRMCGKTVIIKVKGAHASFKLCDTAKLVVSSQTQQRTRTGQSLKQLNDITDHPHSVKVLFALKMAQCCHSRNTGTATALLFHAIIMLPNHSAAKSHSKHAARCIHRVRLFWHQFHRILKGYSQ